MTKEELVKLDITIVRLKHEINEIVAKLPTSFIKDKNYNEKKKLLDSKLNLQMKHDLDKYKRNMSIIPKEINSVNLLEIENTEKYNNLSLTEKELLKTYNYDYKTDDLKLFSKNPKDTLLTKKWKELRKQKNIQSIRDYYNDRDWNS